MVEARPGVPASDWRLSAEGRARAAQLAAHLVPYAPSRLVSSLEPKAVETAAILGKRLGLGVEIVPGLHEHERRSVPYLGAEAFAAAITRFFATPQERVFGQESAAEALGRFAGALHDITASHAARGPQAILIVTHGTVLSLYAAAATGADAHGLWQALDLPALVVLASTDEPARPYGMREIWSPAT